MVATAGDTMNKIYKFIAGGSRVTPVGIVIAIAAALSLGTSSHEWAAPVYLAILLLTLAVSTAEPVQ